MSRKRAKGNTDGVIGNLKLACERSLVAVENIADIGCSLGMVLPPCRIIKDALLDLGDAIGKYNFRKIRKCIVGFKSIHSSRSVLNDQLYKLGTVLVALRLKESLGNSCVFSKRKGNSLSVRTRIIKYVVIDAKVTRDRGSIINVLKSRALVEGRVSKHRDIAKDTESFHSRAPREAGISNADDTCVKLYVIQRHARLEGSVSNGGKSGRKGNALQGFRVAECHISEHGNRIGHYKALQRGTIVKCHNTNRCKPICYGYAFQRRAIRKGIGVNGLNPFVENNGFQRRTTVKRLLRYRFGQARNRNRLERGTSFKRGYADMSQALREIDFLQIGTVLKSVIIDILNRVGQNNFL